MSVRSMSFASVQPGAGVADATNLVTATFMSLQGTTTTERLVMQEVFIGGLAPSASSPMVMVLARAVVFGAGTLTLAAGAKDAATDGSSATGTVRGYTSFVTTAPQRNATLGLLNCAMNAFGGNFKWFPSNIPGKDISSVGNTQPLGEMILSAFTGSTAGAAIGAHLLYETI